MNEEDNFNFQALQYLHNDHGLVVSFIDLKNGLLLLVLTKTKFSKDCLSHSFMSR